MDLNTATNNLIRSFREQLAAQLSAQGLRPATLARRKGCGGGYISNVLNKDFNLSQKNMAELAFALGFEVQVSLKPIEGWVAPAVPEPTGRRKKAFTEEAAPTAAPEAEAAPAASTRVVANLGEMELDDAELAEAEAEVRAELEELTGGYETVDG